MYDSDNNSSNTDNNNHHHPHCHVLRHRHQRKCQPLPAQNNPQCVRSETGIEDHAPFPLIKASFNGNFRILKWSYVRTIYHIRSYFVGIFLYIGLTYGRSNRGFCLKWPLILRDCPAVSVEYDLAFQSFPDS